jgi:hypothetical protein
MNPENIIELFKDLKTRHDGIEAEIVKLSDNFTQGNADGVLLTDETIEESCERKEWIGELLSLEKDNVELHEDTEQTRTTTTAIIAKICCWSLFKKYDRQLKWIIKFGEIGEANTDAFQTEVIDA